MLLTSVASLAFADKAGDTPPGAPPFDRQRHPFWNETKNQTENGSRLPHLPLRYNDTDNEKKFVLFHFYYSSLITQSFPVLPVTVKVSVVTVTGVNGIVGSDLPVTVSASVVTVTVFNMLGQEVVKLADHQQFAEGTNHVQFDAARYASGVYFYRLLVNDLGTGAMKFQQVRKMMLVK